MQPFTEKAVAVIRSIPEGKVMTYGGVAAAAGSPRGARQVVRILHAMSRSHKLPWHRIVNAKGRIALGEEGSEIQRLYLLGEGIRFNDSGAIDLKIYGYDPQMRD